MSRSSVALRLSSAASSLRDFAEQPFVAATRDALPWSFIALLVTFVAFIPFVPVEGPFISPRLGLRVAGALVPAFGVMGAALAPALGFFYARRAEKNRAVAAASCLIAYLVALPPFSGAGFAYLQVIGPSGLFLALLIGCVYAIVASYAKHDWIAAACVIGFAAGARVLHISLTVYVEAALHPLALLGDTYVALVLIVLIETLLWAIGIHGPALLAAVVTPVYLTLQLQNSQAFNAHAPLPHIVVVSIFLFVFPGGAGATLPLAVFCAISRVKRLRNVGRVALVPALINVNEPLLFGAPVVMNPYLVPPFVLVPLVVATTTYLAMDLNWVARPAFYLPSSIPTLISVYVATLDWRAIVLVCVNITFAALIYLPFFRAYERHLALRQAQDDKG